VARQPCSFVSSCAPRWLLLLLLLLLLCCSAALLQYGPVWPTAKGQQW
jgi:hypothetical protein